MSKTTVLAPASLPPTTSSTTGSTADPAAAAGWKTAYHATRDALLAVQGVKDDLDRRNLRADVDHDRLAVERARTEQIYRDLHIAWLQIVGRAVDVI